MRIGDLRAMRREVERRRNESAFSPALVAQVTKTIERVKRGGDAAVLAEVRRFDRRAATGRDLWLDAKALKRAARSCPRELRDALDLAHDAIRAFHAKQRPRAVTHRGRDFREALVPQALRRVGGCVPRGATGYPSTALMIGVPARVAGVEELVLVSPLPRDGAIDPALAYAATLVEADGLYRAGGAAGVAALAYGTRSLEKVDKIVGPGNAYTTIAKWLVSSAVGIDGLQGPSELVVVASGDADATAIVLDLQAQAEHGGGPFAALVSDDRVLLATVAAVIERMGAPAGTIGLYQAPSLDAALDAAIFAAPEHVHLAGARASRLAGRTKNAGAVFVGTKTAVAFGDYVAGSNHVLPTGGSARWASPLRVDDFVRWTTRVRATGPLGRSASAGSAIASHEGMRYHASSMELRGS